MTTDQSLYTMLAVAVVVWLVTYVAYRRDVKRHAALRDQMGLPRAEMWRGIQRERGE